MAQSPHPPQADPPQAPPPKPSRGQLLADPLYQENLAWLLAFPKFGQGTGLTRMARVHEALLREGHTVPPAIKVTGSNGKGSVVAMLGAMLSQLGLRPGVYTSPHLFLFNERICIGDQPVSNQEIAEGIHWLKGFLGQLPSAECAAYGAFEIFTALALYHFTKLGLSHLVLEAGIGGRYDAIRPFPGQVVGLTSLDLEHTQLLGSTLLEIAQDKIDLCPQAGHLVLNDLGPEAPLPAIRQYAAERGLHVHEVLQETRIQQASPTAFQLTTPQQTYPAIALGLRGAHQVQNARVAVRLLELYLETHPIPNPNLAHAVPTGLASVQWPGRAAVLSRDPLVVVDVGHTPQAVAAFVACLGALVGQQKILLVTGISDNKRVEAILHEVLPIAARVLCTQAFHGTPPEQLRALIGTLRPDLPCELAPTLPEAVARALALARTENLAVVVAGGLFLAIGFQACFEGDDPALLRFF